MHLKRIPAPKIWPIKRKIRKFIARPMPGPHCLNDCITLNILLKDFLNQAKTTKEVKFILNNGKILVNKIPRKEYRFPLGIMDIIEIPDLKQKFILLFNEKNRFSLNPIKDSNTKLCKIIGKKVVKNKKVQINLHDGRNLLLDKNNYAVGDTIVFDLENKKVKDHLKLEKDVMIYLNGGSCKGHIGKLQKIDEGNGYAEQKITFLLGKEVHTTLKKYAFVVGKDKSLIEVKE
ncbi:MAG: 30S ribosomal protein S4e [Candidatus Nanoarchaeia archaeon]|nr:30S ribosomal protein S4e [Candidatus Nanoarchaeia archaeon]